MSKGKGWDNSEHRQNSKKLGEAYEQRSNIREFKREPYDPSKEKITELIGRIPVGPHHIHIELSSYNGGPEGVSIRKVKADGHSLNLGKFWGNQFEQLTALLAQAGKTMDEKNARAKAAKAAAFEAEKADKRREHDMEFVRKVVGK